MQHTQFPFKMVTLNISIVTDKHITITNYLTKNLFFKSCFLKNNCSQDYILSERKLYFRVIIFKILRTSIFKINDTKKRSPTCSDMTFI